MGISPLVWGKEGWRFIHYVALAYPDNPTKEDRKNYRKFLNSLENVLPCPACAYNFKKKMELHPPNLNSTKEFFQWTVDMHNFVNEENGKKKLSYVQAYNELSKKNKFDIKSIPYILPPAIMLSIMIFTIAKKR
jgi:hypothetical protein